MTLEAFNNSLPGQFPPDNISLALQALWFDAKDNWEKAHQLIADEKDKASAWVHAYLHRKEGDIWNADYWYNRAGKKRTTLSLQQEWSQITADLLASETI